jgi:hypothetical protein
MPFKIRFVRGYLSKWDFPITVQKKSRMSTTLSLSELVHVSRVGYIKGLISGEHEAFILDPKSQKQFPCTVDSYVSKVVELVNWDIALSIDMDKFPVGGKDDAKFVAELKFATESHRHVSIKGALRLDANGNIMEDMVAFTRVHAAVAALFKDPRREVFVHLVGFKKNVLVAPKVLGQLAQGVLTLEGGLSVPGEPQSEIDIVVRPIDLVKGVPAVTVVVMCGHLSNFHGMPAGTTPRSLGCCPDDCPDLFMDFPMLTAEQALHAFKTVAALVYPKQFALERKGMSAEQSADLLAAVGPTDVGEDDVHGLILGLYAKMKVSSAPDAKSLGRKVPLGPSYFRFATGVRREELTPLASDRLALLGFQPIIQAACLTARLSGDDDELKKRVALVSETFGQFAEVEGALHGGKKSSKGEHMFGGDSHDNEWGAVGCPRNFAEVTGLRSGKELPANHLGRGVSLVAGAMCGDKDTMDFLGLTEPLTFENAKQTAGLIINLIWRRIRAAAES